MRLHLLCTLLRLQLSLPCKVCRSLCGTLTSSSAANDLRADDKYRKDQNKQQKSRKDPKENTEYDQSGTRFIRNIVHRQRICDIGIARAADKFGNQCIVVSVDAKQRSDGGAGWEIFTHGGRNATGIDAVEFAKLVAAKGAGEILLTSMDRDGTRAGFNLPLTRAVSDAVTIPVIASGGVGTLDHLVEGVTLGGASAVLAASIFHFGEYTIGEAKAYMAAAGIPMRLT